MTKQDIINQICADMRIKLPNPEDLQYLNYVMTANLAGYELKETQQLPSTEVYDNEWILKRYEVDLIATEHQSTTIKNYIWHLKRFFETTKLCYRYTTSQDISDYIAVIKLKNNASLRYTISNQKILRAFFRWAYRKHHIDEDITRDIDSIKNRQRETERLTDTEIASCRRAILNRSLKEKRMSALFELMMCTGMRVGEIERIDIEDIDFIKGRIVIHGEKNQEKRTGFLNKSCIIAIREYIANRSQGALFLAKNKARLSKCSIETIAKEIGILGNCHCTTTVHIYRKTFASILYQKTSDIYLVSKMLGHSSPKVTSDYYIKNDVEDMYHKMPQF